MKSSYSSNWLRNSLLLFMGFSIVFFPFVNHAYGQQNDSRVDEELKKAEDMFERISNQLAKVEETQESIQTGEGVSEKVQGAGGCLIATASYGTELAPEVQSLREIRDNVIMETNSGEAFLNGFNQIYYTFSPTIADWERENQSFRTIVKLTITPLITSLSILNYVDMDSKEAVLAYGIGLILMNIGMYFVLPIALVVKIKKVLIK